MDADVVGRSICEKTNNERYATKKGRENSFRIKKSKSSLRI